MIWPGILLLSASWMFFLPVFFPADLVLGYIVLVSGIVCVSLGMYGSGSAVIDKKHLLFIIPLFLSVFFVEAPYNTGLIVIAAGLAGLFIAGMVTGNDKHAWIGKGLFFSGMVLVIQAALMPFLVTFSAIYHRVDFLSWLLRLGLDMAGLKTTLIEGTLYVHTYQRTYSLITTLESLGFFLWFNIFAGAVAAFFFRPDKRKFVSSIAGFLVISLVYSILRVVAMIVIFSEAGDLNIFWDPLKLFLSFVPLAIILSRFYTLRDLDVDFGVLRKAPISWNRFLIMILAASFVFFSLGAAGYQDPGEKKQGRVLIDEFHSNWESSLRDMDKEWYGQMSTYNYYSLAEWFDLYFHVDRNEDRVLTADLLDDYDILILKCPTDPYSEKEVRSIVDFVEMGGGLFLIGDHTNVFGMNYYLNLVANEFGLKFNNDATHLLKTGSWSVFKPPGTLPHPAVQSMEEFKYLTSCSLEAPLTAEMVMIGPGLQGVPGAYSTKAFFREGKPTPNMIYGFLLQSAAVKHGKGRVLTFTDSTCFSSYCVFMDGYPAYLLGSMDYLNRSNVKDYLNAVFLVLALVSLTLLLLLSRKESKAFVLLLILSTGTLSFGAAASVFGRINRTNYPPPEPHTDFPRVCFVEDDSNFIIDPHPIHRRDKDLRVKRFNTFFIWTQRVNLYPSVEKTLDDAMAKGDVVVIINPVGSFDKERIESIASYVKAGGNLLVLDGVINTGSTTNEMLQNFGINVFRTVDDYRTLSEYDSSMVDKGVGPRVGIGGPDGKADKPAVGSIARPSLLILGGKKVFVTDDGISSMAIVEHGEGKIVVVVDSYTFSDVVMGHSFHIPDEHLRKVYDTEYYIFEEIFFGDR